MNFKNWMVGCVLDLFGSG